VSTKQKVIATLTGVAVVLALILTIASASKIGPRQEGVVVTWGKVSEHTLPSGMHWLNPFATVEKIDTSIQTLKLDSSDNKGKDDKTPPIFVRLKYGQSANVPVTARWHITATDKALVELYKSNKTTQGGVFDNIKENVVESAVKQCVQEAFSAYDPLAYIQAGQDQADVPSATTTLQNYTVDCLKNIQTKGIEFVSVLVQIPVWDDQTQQSIQDYTKALAAYRIAVQLKQTNEAIAAANAVLASQPGTNDPGVMYANCLALIKYLAESGKLGDLPETFTCDNKSGQVIVQAK